MSNNVKSSILLAAGRSTTFSIKNVKAARTMFYLSLNQLQDAYDKAHADNPNNNKLLLGPAKNNPTEMVATLQYLTDYRGVKPFSETLLESRPSDKMLIDNLESIFRNKDEDGAVDELFALSAKEAIEIDIEFDTPIIMIANRSLAITDKSPFYDVKKLKNNVCYLYEEGEPMRDQITGEIMVRSAFHAHRVWVPDSMYNAVLRKAEKFGIKRYRSLIDPKTDDVVSLKPEFADPEAFIAEMAKIAKSSADSMVRSLFFSGNVKLATDPEFAKDADVQAAVKAFEQIRADAEKA